VLISLSISLYFSYPIVVIVDRYAIASRAMMAMPETAVNEYHFLPGAENEVGATWQVLTMKPVTIALCMEELSD